MRTWHFQLRLLLASTLALVLVGIYPGFQQVSAEITCLNSDYNCIYFEVGNTNNRVVCTRSVCGSGFFGESSGSWKACTPSMDLTRMKQ